MSISKFNKSFIVDILKKLELVKDHVNTPNGKLKTNITVNEILYIEKYWSVITEYQNYVSITLDPVLDSKIKLLDKKINEVNDFCKELESQPPANFFNYLHRSIYNKNNNFTTLNSGKHVYIHDIEKYKVMIKKSNEIKNDVNDINNSFREIQRKYRDIHVDNKEHRTCVFSSEHSKWNIDIYGMYNRMYFFEKCTVYFRIENTIDNNNYMDIINAFKVDMRKIIHHNEWKDIKTIYVLYVEQFNISSMSFSDLERILRRENIYLITESEITESEIITAEIVDDK